MRSLATLHRELEEREAKIRRLVDANISGSSFGGWKVRFSKANDAFLRTLGYNREDLASGRLHRTGLTPPEWRARTECAVSELEMTGTIQLFEKEYLRKDGSRLPVLLGAASFDETANQGVSFVPDLTERKRAEDERRESEQRYRELAMELAHANCAATMGSFQPRSPMKSISRLPQSSPMPMPVCWLGGRPTNLDISGEGDLDSVFVEVQDTGPGLDSADLDRLFRSFYTTKPDGMGMGLAISRSIAEAHGGRLSAAPNKPRGAVFRLTLPLEETLGRPETMVRPASTGTARTWWISKTFRKCTKGIRKYNRYELVHRPIFFLSTQSRCDSNRASRRGIISD